MWFPISTLSAAAAEPVGDAAALRAAYADPDVSEITLTANIAVSCDSAGFVRESGDGTLAIDGQGKYVIQQSCNSATTKPNGILNHIAPGSLTVRGLTIIGARNLGEGGAIRSPQDDVTVFDSTFKDNTAQGRGGALYVLGSLRVYDSIFADGGAGSGGAIFAGARRS